jgi:thiol:disulfide interchange protein DsbD
MTLLENPLDYFNAFIGGVGMSFTPCVLPLIPIVVGYIGINAATTKRKGFALSFTYVTGVAITYAALGLVASLTGQVFGTISHQPVTKIIAGLIIIIFGLSMLDLFFIPLPRLKPPTFAKINYITVFLLGLVSGLIISPCTVGVLTAILLYLASKKNIFYGATVLLTFAYGMGLILILAGTFSSILIILSKTAKLTVYIKRFFSFVLIVIGVYLFYNGIIDIGRF